MILCTPALVAGTSVVFVCANLVLCGYIRRVQNSFVYRGMKYLGITIGNVCAVGTSLGLHADSTCNMGFITWGAITFALSLCACVMESCVYATHCPDPPVSGAATVTRSGAAARKRMDLPPQGPLRGTVICMGDRAATISEINTRRQFVASFKAWERHGGDYLSVGRPVVFSVDVDRLAVGEHIVGDRVFRRFYCVPADDDGAEPE